MMVGFDARPWIGAGGTGASYSDLAHHQTTWETNAVNATASRGVLTDYSSGARGASLRSGAASSRRRPCSSTDLDLVYPGALAAARRSDAGHVTGAPRALAVEPADAAAATRAICPASSRRSPGHEGKSVGNLHFAGEHTNSFYEWQGFMEGAALSGIDAAQRILKGV